MSWRDSWCFHDSMPLAGTPSWIVLTIAARVQPCSAWSSVRLGPTWPPPSAAWHTAQRLANTEGPVAASVASAACMSMSACPSGSGSGGCASSHAAMSSS